MAMTDTQTTATGTQTGEARTGTRQDGQGLIRGLGLFNAVSLNMAQMVGIGPFITIPLIVVAMGGPTAVFGWIAGALIAICDGLVWASCGRRSLSPR